MDRSFFFNIILSERKESQGNVVMCARTDGKKRVHNNTALRYDTFSGVEVVIIALGSVRFRVDFTVAKLRHCTPS